MCLFCSLFNLIMNQIHDISLLQIKFISSCTKTCGATRKPEFPYTELKSVRDWDTFLRICLVRSGIKISVRVLFTRAPYIFFENFGDNMQLHGNHTSRLILIQIFMVWHAHPFTILSKLPPLGAKLVGPGGGCHKY